MRGLIHCIYASATERDFSEDDLTALLRKSRERNQASRITGMLLHVEGSFFQVIEGEGDNVDALFAKIALDTRHSKVTVIAREPIARRSFGEWTMGSSTMTKTEVSGIVGGNDFFSTGSCLTSLDNRRAKKLLAAFGKGRWRTTIRGTGELARDSR